MTDSRHERLAEIFLAARALPAGERAAHVAAAAAGDAELAGEVLAMLRFEERSNAFLAAPVTAPPAALAALSAGAGGSGAALPARIGSYRILRRLGEGGMGVVLAAEQENPRRVVALKLIRPAFATAAALRRFAAEGQILGRLQHPGIAQIYEAGLAECPGGDRQPFFAMELVEGRSLAQFVAEQALSRAATLELFRAICDAVEHAHRKGVIHRDLKPSNILVEANGRPKVLDFGVARVVDDGGAGVSLTAAAGEIVGTLSYMSPEQAEGDAAAIDTRSDVYSLGVILFELLAGRLPIDLEGKSLASALLHLREAEPPRLASVRPELAGDLDAIVAMALARDPERRYAGAAALAADLGRHLRREPIEARPPSRIDSARRFVARNRLAVGASAVVALSLIGGLVATLLQREEADRRRREAEVAREEADAINQYLLLDMLRSPDPRRDGRAVRVVDVLQRAADGIATRFAGRPTVEAAVRDALGTSYRALALLPEAEREIARAVELRAAALGEDHPDTLAARAHLVPVLSSGERSERALALAKEVLAARRRVLGPEHPDTLTSQADVAELCYYAGDPTGLDLLRETALARERVLGPDHARTLMNWNNVAVMLLQTSRFEEAEQIQRRVLAAQVRSLGAEHPDTLTSQENLAQLLEDQGRLEGAEELYRELLEVQTRVHGADHPDATRACLGLGIALARRGLKEEAEPLYLRALDIRRRNLGPDHAETLEALREFVRFRLESGEHAEAERLADELVLLQRGREGGGGVDLAGALNTLGRIQGTRKDYAAAERSLSEAVAIYRAAAGGPNPGIHQTLFNLGSVIRDGGDPARALPVLQEVVELDARRYGARHEKVANSRAAQGKAELMLGRGAEGEASFRFALEVLEGGNLSAGRRAGLEASLGRSLLLQGRAADAEPVLAASAPLLLQQNGAGSAAARDAVLALADALDGVGRVDEAAAWRAKLEP